MDTKTKKQEALSLLAKIDPEDRDYLGQNKFCFHLNLWTAERAGYTIKDAIGGWEVAEPDDDRFEFVSFLTDAIPSYTHSVDACLTLISEHRYTVHHLMGSFRVRLYPENADVEGVYADARSLSISMLKAWWTLQD